MTQRKLSPMQTLLAKHLQELGIAEDEILFEHKFSPERNWRLDLYLPDLRLGIEISGGQWTGGHRRGKAQEDEYDKLNHAQMNGIRVFQFSNEQVGDGRAKDFLAGVL